MNQLNVVKHKGQFFALGPVELQVMEAGRRWVGYDELVGVTGSPRKSLHVIVHRLRSGGLLQVSAPGTRDVEFKIAKGVQGP